MTDELNDTPEEFEDDELLDDAEETVDEVETDESDETGAPEEEQGEPVEVTGRIFKIGATKIEDTEATAGKTPEQVRMMLKGMYPELANATKPKITTSPEGVQVIEWSPQPGRKG